MSRKLAPAFLTFLVLVLCAVIALAVTGAIMDPKNRVQNLSAIASSTSAMVAAVVALWVAWREYDNRERTRRESEQKEYNARKRIAALLAGNIMAWCDRKDIQDLLSDLAKIESKDSIEGYVKLAVIAKKSPQRADEPDATFWLPEIAYIARAIRLDAFDRLSSIPNVWSVQFRREREGDLRGMDPDFFAAMDTIWTNLEMSAQKLSRSFATLAKIRKDEPDFFQLLVSVVFDEGAELKRNVAEFLDVAKTAGKTLLVYTEESVPPPLRAPAALLANSRKGSQGLAEAWRIINLTRSAPVILSALTDVDKTLGEFADNAKTAGQHLEEIQRFVRDAAAKLPTSNEPPK